MLGQERSWAEEITNARTLRGMMLGAFQALQGLGHRDGGEGTREGAGRIKHTVP